MYRKKKFVEEIRKKSGKFTPGEKNSITDIKDVNVGHLTISLDIPEPSG